MQHSLDLQENVGAVHLGCKVGTSRGHLSDNLAGGSGQAPEFQWPPRGPNAAAQWAEAYAELEFELASLRRDNDALIAEVRGRRRAQHGSRSERVTSEQLLVGMRELKETDPELVPPGMLEELEQECAERARKREARQAAKAAKLKRRAEAAARQAAGQRKGAASPDGDGDDDGGGGGSGSKATAAAHTNPTPSNVIPLRPISQSRRNACLENLTPADHIQVVTDAERHCPECSQERKVLGFEDTHMLDIVLPKLQALRIRREKRACPQHPETGVATAPAVARPLAQSLPTATLLAFIVISKVVDHLPLERLSGILQRWGARVAPSTLGDWYHRAAKQLAPIAEHLGKQILASTLCLHTDGSFMRVIDPRKPGGSVQAGLWGYTVPSVGAYFRVTEDQSFAETRQLLSAREGPTMTDGHKAYQSQRLPGSTKAVPVLQGLHLNCWAHARRPFEKALSLDGDQRATVVLRLIRSLYQVERYIKENAASIEDIALLRCALGEPVVDALFAHLRRLEKVVPPKSRFGQGIQTVLRRERHLRAYLRDGRLPIDNNAQESQFRSKALGQHSWLFVGNHQAATHYAVLLTLVRSCILLDVDPLAYLDETLLRVQDRGSAAALDDLLPAAFKARQFSADRVAA